jgi:hypothetical protein
MKCIHMQSMNFFQGYFILFYLTDSGSNEGRTHEEEVPMESRIFLLCVITNTKEKTGMAQSVYSLLYVMGFETQQGRCFPNLSRPSLITPQDLLNE